MARLITLLLLFSTYLSAQSVGLRITIRDAESNQPLPYVSIQLSPGAAGGTTREEGTIDLGIPAGRYVLRASYTGYAPLTDTLVVLRDTSVMLDMQPSPEQLQTVTVTDRPGQQQLMRPALGVERLSAGALESIPTVLGERDVLKSLQLLPGVSSAGEASNGISVRGGTIDQNLLLYDGAPVFTPTHLFGLFTVFTPDAVGGANLYRGNIPARFGGRVASVLDVRSATPGTEAVEIRGGIGLVSSHLSVEGPLDRRKRWGLLLSARGGVNDFVFSLIERLRNTESRFADATLKLRYRAGESDFLTLTGFFSQDYYQIDLLSRIGGLPATTNQYAYRTLNGGLQWLRVISPSLALTAEVHRADYDPELRFPQAGGGRIDFSSPIDYYIGRAALSLTAGDHRAMAGIQYDAYNLQPGRLDPGGVNGIIPVELDAERGRERAVYVEDEWEVSDRLNLSGGLRYVSYVAVGPGQLRRYQPGREVERRNLVESREVAAGETLARYHGLEPRLGASFRLLQRTSLKAAYARGRQYLQNIYNATTPLPTSRWAISGPNIVPQTSDLFSVGVTHQTADAHWTLQLEAYYRQIRQVIEYKPGADFFLNPAVETDLLRGRGRGYGVELSLRRETGRLTGEVNYAYARSENRVTGPSAATRINRGNWYPGYFDQPHALVANLVLDEGQTHELGFNLIVQSNRPYTVPNGFVTIRDTPVPLFLERNNDRLPVYHRLDFSWTIHNLRREKRRWTGEWVFTVYNVYGRDNAYNVFFQPKDANTQPLGIFQGSPFAAYRLSIFGAPILSLSYKFRLLP